MARAKGGLGDSGEHGEKLAFATVARIDVLEVAERHPDCFFIVYTNGTLVDDVDPAMG